MSDPVEDDDSVDESVAAFLRGVARAPETTPATAASVPGSRIAQFVVRARLGSGGMGVVYEAEDERLGRFVALKVLSHAESVEARSRLLREARAASRIVHPNVATVYEVGETDEGAYIAMELVHGRTMRAWLREPRSIEARLAVAREVARALAQAHAVGIVHRDLKPDNVMVTPEGSVKVLDFGLAKQSAAPTPRPDDPPLTEEGRVVGTPCYMSPEQAKGKAVDARSDVFSFGVLLYEAMTGVRPFAGETSADVLIAIDRDEPIAPRARAPDVPASVERVIVRALAKRPEDRFANGDELVAALGEVTPAVTGTRTASWWGLGLGAVAIALLAVLAAALHRGTPLSPVARDASAPTPMTEVAPHGSSNAEAIEAYRTGLQMAHEARSYAYFALGRASAIDPAFAEAHLRGALLLLESGMVTEAREEFRAAMAHRVSLDERDRTLLDAFEPMFQRTPVDAHATSERLGAAVARFPDDAEIAYYRGAVAESDDPDSAPRDYERALELDPSFARAALALGKSELSIGHIDEANLAIDRCLRIVDGSTLCLLERARILSHEGACSQVEAVARRILTVDPGTFEATMILAGALAAQGKPLPAIRELVDRATLPDGGAMEFPVTFFGAAMRAEADILEGNFEGALERLRAVEPALDRVPFEGWHGQIAAFEAGVLGEMGRDREAVDVARAFIARHDAWEPSPGADVPAIEFDALGDLLGYASRGGALTESEAEALRAADAKHWLERVRTPAERGLIWEVLYASATETPQEAKAALATLPTFGSPPELVGDLAADAVVGHTYLLAGRVTEALPMLERATRACDFLVNADVHMGAFYDLAEAREAAGDASGACAAYASVLDRWGRARPRSVTAEKARARMKALSCKT